MSGESSRELLVPLPPPVRTGGSFGPFPSARDALKFSAYAAVGAVVAGLTTAFAWLPFLAFGYFVATYRLDGRAPDHRLRDLVEFGLRVHGHRTPADPTAEVGPGAGVRIDDHSFLTVLETGGIPVAFLPPAELHRLFDEYRALLRTIDPGAGLWMEAEPFPALEFLPPNSRERGGSEAEARIGYAELVKVLCRKRYRRRVWILLWEFRSGASAVLRLDDRASAVAGALSRLGLAARRLRGERLVTFLRRSGWNVVSPGA